MRGLDTGKVIKEAIDVANFAMMIADNIRPSIMEEDDGAVDYIRFLENRLEQSRKDLLEACETIRGLLNYPFPNLRHDDRELFSLWTDGRHKLETAIKKARGE